MKTTAGILLCMLIILSCKKNIDSAGTTMPPSTGITDSSLAIVSMDKIDFNEVNISYVAKAPAGKTFTSLYLQWSKSADFLQETDSAIISSSSGTSSSFQLKKLSQAAKYYCRISALFNGKTFFSATKEWVTDSLKILQIGYLANSWELNRGDSNYLIITNLPSTLPVSVAETKVFIGATECVVANDYSQHIYFHVPQSLKTGKYKFELRRRGAIASAPDSVEIFKGLWSGLTAPDLPLNTAASSRGLYWFGTCQSASKGYMVGGKYENGSLPWPQGYAMHFILEYDPSTQSWTKRVPTTNRFLENPVTYHFNNNIYILGGIETAIDAFGNSREVILRKMLRLDLSTMQWIEMDAMPTYPMYKPAHFQVDNEWYVGLGSDSSNVNASTGRPEPSKKLWKYNPVSNQWTRLGDFPGAHQDFPTFFTIGSKVYAFYGAIPIGTPYIATTFKQELWEYTPATDNWRQLTLPASGPAYGEKYQIIVNNGKAYFITGQKYSVGVAFYYYALQNTCLEWDPATNVYKPFAKARPGEIMQLVYSGNNKFVFQSDALGYFERTPNKTFMVDLSE